MLSNICQSPKIILYAIPKSQSHKPLQSQSTVYTCNIIKPERAKNPRIMSGKTGGGGVGGSGGEDH